MFTLEIIGNNLSHFIASDAHNTTTRGFMMREAFDIINKTFGPEWVYYFKKNARQVIVNGEISLNAPKRRKIRKKLFGRF